MPLKPKTLATAHKHLELAIQALRGADDPSAEWLCEQIKTARSTAVDLRHQISQQARDQLRNAAPPPASDHKHISLCPNSGYQVKIQRKGQLHRKYFGFGKHGIKGALPAAIQWRNSILEQA